MTPAYFETHFQQDAPYEEWPAQFAIITAYASTGETWPKEENEAADEALRQVLEKSGQLLCRVTGFSPITGHYEPGWAAGTSWQDACDLGLRFRQEAIYYVIGDELWVTYCDARRKLVRVGHFRERMEAKLPFLRDEA